LARDLRDHNAQFTTGGLFVLFLLAESGSGKSTLIKLLINNLNQGTEPYFLNINLVAVDISHTPVYVI